MNNIFKNLIIFDIANNHNGDINKALNIISEFADIIKVFPYFNYVFKFQYRQIDSYIHPLLKNNMNHKYIKRFIETQLSISDYNILIDNIKNRGYLTAVTPFDNDSIPIIKNQNFDIIKIASASTTDWQLLEEVITIDLPFIISTGCSSLQDINDVVNFFENKNKKFALLHCVSQYPTSLGNLELNQIDLLNSIYPEIPIGFSSHENPNKNNSAFILIGKQVTLFEKHIDLDCDTKNLYSMTPKNCLKWLINLKEAYEMCGVENKRHDFLIKELQDLRQFKRGVFAKEDLFIGDNIKDKIFYAFPSEESQLVANDISKYKEFVLKNNISKNKPIYFDDVEIINKKKIILDIIKDLKKIIIDSNIVLPDVFPLQLSHHYGLEKFKQIGVAIIDILNKEYCKKYLILLPNQSHPSHYHKIKIETFICLHGEMHVFIESGEELLFSDYGQGFFMKKGDVYTIEQKEKHSFSSENSCVFEEISTTHYNDDSYYDDDFIKKNFNNRKTNLTIRKKWLESL